MIGYRQYVNRLGSRFLFEKIDAFTVHKFRLAHLLLHYIRRFHPDSMITKLATYGKAKQSYTHIYNSFEVGNLVYLPVAIVP